MTTILIADDLGENRYLLRSLFEGHGYKVVPAADGAEALALAQASPPDLIVSDILMPVMDGFELCRRWRQDERLRGIPFVIYTATYTDPHDEQLALRLGADRFLLKPQRPEALLQVVREVLERHHRDPTAVRAAPADEEAELLRLHGEALTRKLEQKVQALQAEIARRTQVEEALRTSERRFRQLAENTRDVVWAIGFDGRFTYVSPAVEQLQGFTPAEVLQLPLVEVLGPETLRRFQEELAPVLADMAAGRDPIRDGLFVLQQPCKNGSTVWTEVSAGIMRDESGRAVGIQGVTRDITERRRAEDRAKEERAWSEAVVDGAPVIIVALGERSRILVFNRFAERTTGYAASEVLGQEWIDIFIPQELRPGIRGVWDQIIEGGAVQHRHENEIVTKAGERRLVRWTNTALGGSDGSKMVVSIGEDVTGLRKAEAALAANDALLRLASETARFGGWAVDLATGTCSWSDAVAEIHEMPRGYAPPVAEGIGFYAPEWRAKIERVFVDCAEHGVPYDQEMEIVTRGGKRLWIRTTGEAVRDPNGRIVRVQGSFQDIGQRKQAEEAMAARLEELRRWQAVMVDHADRSRALKREVNELLRRLGQPPRYASAASGTPEETPQPPSQEPGRRATDERRAVAEAERGRLALLDVLEDRQLSEQRERQLSDQLLQAQKMESIGRLAGGVAHDFNNLLSVVLSYAEFALGSVRAGDPLRADLEEIRKAGERAATLTRQLLAFSRKQVLAPEVLSLNRVVGDLEGLLRRLLGEDISVESRLVAELGSVEADPGQLEQVILNLAVNARDAMPGGGRLTIETANVEVDASQAEQHLGMEPGRFVLLSVSDSGCGMDAATRTHLFEPFFTTKEKGRGTGLGLSTVYGIVKQTGGNILVYSEPGRGTTFKIYLPRVDQPAVEPKARPVSVIKGGSETVLVVEDEEAVRRIAERILRGAGYRVETAPNGGEALLLCERLGGRIDLLLTDLLMPGMSGRELAVRLAPLCAKLRVLYMSGYADDAIVRNGVLDPGAHFIGKPFSSVDLAQKVREALDTQ